MNVLFVHRAFPGPYHNLAPALAARGHCVLALTMAPVESGRYGVKIIRYGMRCSGAAGVHPWAAGFETEVLHGERVAFVALKLRADGFMPDVICVHPEWGEALFLKDVWRDAKQVNYCEVYHRAHGAEAGFDPEFSTLDVATSARLRARNACNLLSLEASDLGISPTYWQRALFPDWAQARIAVIHHGIDTDLVRPDPQGSFRPARFDRTFFPGDEIVTFVNRDLCPQRGYHVFMRALPALLRLRPAARVVIVGGNGNRSDAAPPRGRTWKDIFFEEVRSSIDRTRVHFLGRVPHLFLLQLLQVSAAHVHLAYPRPVSASLLEAMSAGCLVIGARTPPVEEVIDHERNGLLVDFFDTAELARTIAAVLDDQDAFLPLRMTARADVVAKYDLHRVCLPQQVAFIESLQPQALPPPPHFSRLDVATAQGPTPVAQHFCHPEIAGDVLAPGARGGG
ncbi:MAG TPA: glycosyltransferase [Noviherbaspirillum sp.]|uniref:glycosyltransferase n=1 Tax=Noviherbaspirillum sp. TaxID=1926288 RepID=UPI002D33750E|nr:glycosyltransferase [Noviherbaspirillum sp.]HYD97547.1 glycosyltransferase [Noviherbaspirillum sp.]